MSASDGAQVFIWAVKQIAIVRAIHDAQDIVGFCAREDDSLVIAGEVFPQAL